MNDLWRIHLVGYYEAIKTVDSIYEYIVTCTYIQVFILSYKLRCMYVCIYEMYV